VSGRAQVLVLAVAAIGFALIVWMVRRGRLKERFALLWLAIGVGMFFLVAARPLVDRLSDAVGIRSGTTTLFLAAILFLLGLILHLSVVVSAQEEKLRDLAEAVGLHHAEGAGESSSGGEAAQPVETPDQGERGPQQHP
jgi:hypothetical protein